MVRSFDAQLCVLGTRTASTNQQRAQMCPNLRLKRFWSLLHAYNNRKYVIFTLNLTCHRFWLLWNMWFNSSVVQWITLMFSQVTGQTRGVTLIFHMCVRGWMWQVPSLPHLLALSYLPAAPRAGVLFYTRWKIHSHFIHYYTWRLHCSDFFFLSAVCIQMKKNLN